MAPTPDDVAPDDATASDAAPGAPARQGSGSSRSAFLPIGLTFLVLGLIGFAADGMRTSSFAFLPVGITFLILGMVSKGDGDEDDAEASGGPDVTPR
jgi:hypothetical protein